MLFTSVFASLIPDEEASMCDVKKGDEIRRDFPSEQAAVLREALPKKPH